MHSATKLILARIESNPEEFKDEVRSRWNNILIDLNASCPEEEWEIVNEKIKAIRLDAVHQAIMEELCAPEQKEFNYYGKKGSKTVLTTKEMSKQAFDLLVKTYGTEDIK